MKKLLFYALSLVIVAALFSCENEHEDHDSMVTLPQAVQDYISANYSGYEIEESEQDSLCTGSVVYEVEIENGDDDELELTFDSEGSFLFSESDIENTALPAAVSTSITTNYAGYSIEEAERLDMADGSFQYEVGLKGGSAELEVWFDAAGNVICEEEEDDE